MSETNTPEQSVLEIQAALAKLPADADSPWLNLDKMPYIHKTDDPKASPWNCAVIGRFDYLQTMDYMLEAQPANMRNVLALIQSQADEIAGLREALEEVQRVLAATNQQPRGPIVDTIWYSDHETLFDYIDATLSHPTKE